MTKGFGPLLPGFKHIEFGDMEALGAAITDTTAAIMIEPVQGEGGIRPVPDADLKQMRALCEANGLLLIFDEVQCGVGRTGKMFAHEWAGVTPDIMMVAKGIGGGFPLGLKCIATNSDVVAAGYRHEVITVPAADNVIRLLPPLNITDEDIAEAVSRLDQAASSLAAG